MSSEVNETICHGRYCWLHLRVRAETNFGETIHVRPGRFTGMENCSAPEVLPLVTSPSEWPIWHTPKPIMIPRGVTFFYRYAIFSDGEIMAWERSKSRKVEATASRVEVKDDEFDVTELDDLDDQAVLAPLEDTNILGSLSGKRLILACYHLPVNIFKVGEDWHVSWNDSLIAKSCEDSVSESLQTYWLGTVQVGDVSEEERANIRSSLKELNCVPIFAPAKLLEEAYLGFCKQILWPCFHNVDLLDLSHSFYYDHTGSEPEKTWDLVHSDHYWESFVDLNKLFTTEVRNLVSAGDVVWVHDYHLMLVPKMLRTSMEHKATVPPTENSAPNPVNVATPPCDYLHRIRIIFFLHIPFATSQIYRYLPHGNEIITSLLCADVVGFHAFTHARHFLTTCKRNLGTRMDTLSGGLLRLIYQGHSVCVAIRHVSVESEKIDRQLKSSSCAQELSAAIRAAHATGDDEKRSTKFLIAGIDSCQRLSGVALKLLGFEYFLDQYPAYRDKVVLIQKCTKPGTRVKDEVQCSHELRELSARINSKYGPVVEYSEVDSSRIDFDERMALWLSCDVLMNMSVREGLNMDHLEYVYVKGDNPGVVVASEFCSTVSVLNGALRSNPFDADGIAKALDKALTMSDEERHSRRDRDLPYVKSNTSAEWTRQILNDMLIAVKLAESKALGQQPEVSVLAETDQIHLNTDLVRDAYVAASNRLIVLDYKALRDNESVGKYIKEDINPCHKGRALATGLQDTLRRLSEDPQNLVLILSSLSKDPFEAMFKDLPRVHLAASNGLCVTNVEDELSARGGRKWTVTDTRVDWAKVKEICMPILTNYTERTNGSSIRIREPSLAWSFFRADPEWGASQAAQLTAELNTVLGPYNMEVIENTEKGELEIMPRHLHRGVVIKDILHARERATKTPLEFFLVVGHAVPDEKMFSSTLSFVADKNETQSADPSIFLCTDTKRPSIAKAHLDDVDEVNRFLHDLAQSQVM